MQLKPGERDAHAKIQHGSDTMGIVTFAQFPFTRKAVH